MQAYAIYATATVFNIGSLYCLALLSGLSVNFMSQIVKDMNENKKRLKWCMYVGMYALSSEKNIKNNNKKKKKKNV